MTQPLQVPHLHEQHVRVPLVVHLALLYRHDLPPALSPPDGAEASRADGLLPDDLLEAHVGPVGGAPGLPHLELAKGPGRAASRRLQQVGELGDDGPLLARPPAGQHLAVEVPPPQRQPGRLALEGGVQSRGRGGRRVGPGSRRCPGDPCSLGAAPLVGRPGWRRWRARRAAAAVLRPARRGLAAAGARAILPRPSHGVRRAADARRLRGGGCANGR
mmetsp:Transcript_5087/g.14500  ORF Transcript_5087/g.14500 Transcript_5087/m.14500 type:complete len:217 (+) Transcript_5087:807-1457(+)